MLHCTLDARETAIRSSARPIRCKRLLDVLLIVGLILASGLLAMSELAIGSAAKVTIEGLVEPGIPRRRGGSRSQRGSQAAALDGAGRDDAAGNFGRRLCRGDPGAAAESGRSSRIGPLAPYRHVIGVGVVVLAITFTSLVLADLVPRRIALSRPERIARLGVPAGPGAGDRGHAAGRVLERGRPISCCASWEFAQATSRQSPRKRSRSCCRKGPRRACSRKASTR